MNILERTTTEEYDEDGRLTSRTTVEKYGDDGPVLPGFKYDGQNKEIKARDKHKELIESLDDEQYRVLTGDMMVRYKTKWPERYANALQWADIWDWNGK